ncbi:2'-5' RNA ligase superfamily protein [Geodermatophilus sabuli]|uniref:2'-5' RNA ligase superfamily protein n=1 Tax=Geodermatophilus sabuli TaxID=1564158 RepID=A0A285E780_9ACTN|nr:2'-5' RNA ligase superfamily protein [Geodermatophilus sabuli]
MHQSRDPTETAVIVPIGAAEDVVADHRRALDAAATWGVPAHVTVMYPFVHPTAVDAAVLGRLGAALSSVPAFECSFARCQWFGEAVLWLAPDPEQPFRDLTAAVWQAFPEYAPYGGAFDGVVPHLTVGEVGERRRGSVQQLRTAEAEVSVQLPIRAGVDHALLIAGTHAADSWYTIREFPLRPVVD